MWFPNTCTNAQLYALHYFREGTGVVVEGRPAVVAFRVEPDDVAEDGGIVIVKDYSTYFEQRSVLTLNCGGGGGSSLATSLSSNVSRRDWKYFANYVLIYINIYIKINLSIKNKVTQRPFRNSIYGRNTIAYINVLVFYILLSSYSEFRRWRRFVAVKKGGFHCGDMAPCLEVGI